MNVKKEYGTIVGFDARENDRSFNELWGEGRINNFLIRPNVLKPLSVDVAVWGSVFDVALNASLRREDSLFFNQEFSKADALFGRLWTNLASLTEFCAKVDHILTKPYRVVAITVIQTLGVNEYLEVTHPQESLISLIETDPPEPDDNWILIGFDVADAAQYSALTNCGFETNDRPEGSAFAPYLNDNHLFTSIAKANEYRLFSDARVPEHSPFFVYGLFDIACVK